jgi:DNA repair exonuclease SbcCD ATPase subunit
VKIQAVEITNYKAFLGKHTINGGGKNIFICGENGSGKKSQYFTINIKP